MSRSNNPTIGGIADTLEQYAPTALQEDYDNCGLIIGNRNDRATGVLIAFDVTEATVAEAVAAGCNMIVSHHPLIFRGLKRLTASNATERTVMAAVKSGVAIYAAHTSADNTSGGVSVMLAKQLGLTDIEVLDRREGTHLKLSVFVPRESADTLRSALAAAGAGGQGRYEECSFATDGIGSFRPVADANPYVGERGQLHFEKETRLEMLVPAWRRAAVERALIAVHPYEEPAYEFTTVATPADRRFGSGAIGTLPQVMSVADFATLVKERLHCPALRCSRTSEGRTIRRVAVCGGSGAFLVSKAMRSGADAFVSADIKYHDFVDAEPRMLLIDAGHFETEYCITSTFCNIISEKFPNFAVRLSATAINPVVYI